MKTIKWGIVGLGGIAHSFASAFQSEHAELVGVASRTLQKAYDFSKQYSIPKAYGSYEQLAYDPEIDIVYLATPNSYHKDNMMMILKAGKHVLCEKAITMTKAELDEVLSYAKEKNLIVAEAMTIYHMPLMQAVKKRVDAGEFGQLKMVHAYFGSLKEADPTNRFFNPELGGGALLDIGVYALSFVRFFLSSQPHIRQTVGLLYETGVDEMSSFQLLNEQDELATVTISFRAKLPKQGIIACEDAYITIMNYPRADQALITYADGRTETIESGETAQALNYEVDHLSESLLTGQHLTAMDLTKDVNELMNWAAKEWKMDWLFES
ncbi:Gfo/Idh/MocA family protein [Alkalibacterium sp. MB6]|uniref:Gfo/Idh/MocA family protein n=1 Tax=Alkalibacterium sp. MB6 TaxID=2081965 RepID=UPI001379B291|nr:Gfo/Idh/MocA family oxidoreductase [Alkalibacterium sp. MB6]